MQNLQPNTTLQGGKYIIKKVLGQGGFGITYLAEHELLGTNVAIKEFFMKELCERDESTSRVTLGTSSNREMVERCRQKFLKEARTIFKLNHPNIVRILDVFEENGTAYYVMNYIEGESLGDMVKRRGALPEAEALNYIKEVGKALMYIHEKKINHLDIKPSNIMRREDDGRIMLIDFGVSKQYDLVTSEGTSTTPVGISRGYSPAEQYRQHGVQTFSPQSDVYALAATLYKLLTGVTPPEAMEVQDEGLPIGDLKARNVSDSVITAIQRAMKGRLERTQSIDAFLSALGYKTGNDSEGTEVIDVPLIGIDTDPRLGSQPASVSTNDETTILFKNETEEELRPKVVTISKKGEEKKNDKEVKYTDEGDRSLKDVNFLSKLLLFVLALLICYYMIGYLVIVSEYGAGVQIFNVLTHGISLLCIVTIFRLKKQGLLWLIISLILNGIGYIIYARNSPFEDIAFGILIMFILPLFLLWLSMIIRNKGRSFYSILR